MPHYTFERSDFVDETGLACEAVRFDLENEDLLDLPWLQGVAFAVPPLEPIGLLMAPLGKGEPVVLDYMASPIPLVSGRMKRAWDTAGVSNVQFFETRIAAASDLDEPVEFFAFNVVGRVSAADPQQSVSTRAFGRSGADLFSRFVPRSDINPGLRLFRMAEHLSTIVIDERVWQASEGAGVDTLDFKPLIEWLR